MHQVKDKNNIPLYAELPGRNKASLETQRQTKRYRKCRGEVIHKTKDRQKMLNKQYQYHKIVNLKFQFIYKEDHFPRATGGQGPSGN